MIHAKSTIWFMQNHEILSNVPTLYMRFLFWKNQFKSEQNFVLEVLYVKAEKLFGSQCMTNTVNCITSLFVPLKEIDPSCGESLCRLFPSDPDVDINRIITKCEEKSKVDNHSCINNNDLSHHYRLDNSIYIYISIYDIHFYIDVIFNRKRFFCLKKITFGFSNLSYLLN